MTAPARPRPTYRPVTTPPTAPVPAVRYAPGPGYRGPDLAGASGRRGARRPVPRHGSPGELLCMIGVLLLALATWLHLTTGWSTEAAVGAAAIASGYTLGLGIGTAVILLFGAAWFTTWLYPDHFLEGPG